MPIASMVVELLDGANETALGRLAAMPSLSIYGIRDNRVVAVVEELTPALIDDVARRIALMEEVRGVYPVYLADDDCFE